MKTNISKILGMTAVFGAVVFGGCADYVGVGVGYNDAYYVPDYTPFYADYYYDGLPVLGDKYRLHQEKGRGARREYTH